MAIHIQVKVADANLLAGCELVQLYEESASFALSCRTAGTQMLVRLQSEPALIHANGIDCISFGSDFLVGFDPHSFVRGGEFALGELAIRDNDLHLVAHRPAGPNYQSSGAWLVNLRDGEMVRPKVGEEPTRFKSWSISLDSWKTGELVQVFPRTAR
jgi:hypothetical protein